MFYNNKKTISDDFYNEWYIKNHDEWKIFLMVSFIMTITTKVQTNLLVVTRMLWNPPKQTFNRYI